jgi:5,10-methylene-tetrahydrofolate dehydrogenase/methenyl tetrahydrofolate cyclohydrolase
MNGPSSQSHIIHSKGIFRGLPDIPSHLSGLRAIVVGASGTSGQPMVDVLSSNPERWEKVYALSRRPPKTKKDSNVEHVPMDLLYEPDKIVAILREYRVQA